jgi:hypothetical protein
MAWMKVPFQIDDGTIAVAPESFFVARQIRQSFAAEYFWMQAGDLLAQQGMVVGFRCVDGGSCRRPFVEIDRIALPHAKGLGVDFHFHPPSLGRATN